jgi:hypothetical protein
MHPDRAEFHVHGTTGPEKSTAASVFPRKLIYSEDTLTIALARNPPRVPEVYR